MNGIIKLINKVLYKPPYDILFGRISIAIPKDPSNLKEIDKAFYEGFGEGFNESELLPNE